MTSGGAGEEVWRLFVAVPATPTVRAAARRAIEALERLEVLGALRSPKEGEGVRWVEPENLHLTLRFLGPVPPSRVEPLCRALDEHTNTFSPFMIQLAGVAAFPSLRRPRTIWLGIEAAGAARLAAVAASVEAAVQSVGFPAEERPFRAHLTLGRVRPARGLDALGRELAAAAGRGSLLAAEEWPVEEFCLIRSVLRPRGAEYSVLQRFALPRRDGGDGVGVRSGS